MARIAGFCGTSGNGGVFTDDVLGGVVWKIGGKYCGRHCFGRFANVVQCENGGDEPRTPTGYMSFGTVPPIGRFAATNMKPLRGRKCF